MSTTTTIGSGSGNADWVREYLSDPQIVAVGEMGLDYHYQKDPHQRARQRRTFAQQMGIAAEADRPVVIHTRSAEADTRSILREFEGVTGVMHCFTESVALAEAAMSIGYYVSISGIVTFANADNVREVARAVPLSRLLIETDAPWLAPVPHRGSQNEPGFVTDTAAFLSEMLAVDMAELARITRNNFFELFSRAVPAALDSTSVQKN